MYRAVEFIQGKCQIWEDFGGGFDKTLEVSIGNYARLNEF